MKTLEVTLCEEKKHLRESMAAKKVEIEMLKEKINGKTQVENEHVMLKRKVTNLMKNLEEEKKKLQVDTADLEKKVKD